MPKTLSLDQALSLLRPHTRVYLPGLSAESTALIQALRREPDRAEHVTFFGVWVPGINRFDYASLHEDARAIGFFVPPEFHESFAKGKLLFHPLPYSGIYPFVSRIECDVAFLHLSPPDAAGMCSTGVAADFAPAVWRKAKVRVGLLNTCMPRTRAPSIAFDDLDYVVDCSAELLQYDATEPDIVATRVAANVASLIRDGDTLQIGIGALPPAVLAALKDRRGLRLHSGMISDGVAELIDTGAVSGEPSAIKTGVALGSRELYRRLATERLISFHAVPTTHGFRHISRIRRFIAINSAIAVDLFGQLNVETIAGRQISGVGGVTDFIRGAVAAPQGCAVIALPSTSRSGISRIIATQPRGTPIASSRGEPLIVVTEHGTADLRALSLDARAEALIGVADPAVRAELSDQWRQLRVKL